MRKFYSLLAAVVLMAVGSVGAWADAGDKTVNADIDFSNAISGGAVVGTVNSMTIGNASTTYLTNGWLRSVDGTSVVTIPEAERAGRRDIVNVKFDMAWGNKNAMGSGFRLKDAEGAVIVTFQYARWDGKGTNANNLGVDMSGLVGAQASNAPILDRYTSFDITINYAKKTITTVVTSVNPANSKTFNAALENTNPVATFEHFAYGVGGNTDRADAFDNLVITTEEGDYNVESANYTVNWVIGEEVLKTDTRTGDVGDEITLIGTDKDKFYNEDKSKKYEYASDDVEGKTVVSGDAAVVTITMKEIATFDYTLKAVSDEFEEVLATGSSFVDEPVTKYWNKYIQNEGKWFVAENEDSYSVELNDVDTDFNVDYVPADITAFYEIEEMGTSKSAATEASGARYSAGKALGHAASAHFYAKENIAESGLYTVEFAGAARRSGNEKMVVALRDADGNLTSTGDTIAWSNAGTEAIYKTAENVKLLAGYAFALREATGYNSTSYLDYVALTKTGDLPTYAATVAEAENGAAEADKASAAAGEIVTLTVTPAAGYELDSIKVAYTVEDEEVLVEVSEKNTFVMPEAAVTVAPAFKLVTYAVKVADDIANGSVAATPDSATMGTKVTLAVTPAEFYELDAITVKAGEETIALAEDNSFEMPAGDVVVSATFKETPFEITGKPTPKFSPLADDGATVQYLYNVEAGAFLLGANDWNTRASVSETKGYQFKVAKNDDGATWTLNDSVETQSAWKAVFADNASSVWVDNLAGANVDKWVITELGENKYQIANPSAVADGVLATAPLGYDSRLYLTNSEALGSTWAFVSPEDYAAYLAEYSVWSRRVAPALKTLTKSGSDLTPAIGKIAASMDGWTIDNTSTFHINTWSWEGLSDGSWMTPSFLENWRSKDDNAPLPEGTWAYTIKGLVPGQEYVVSALIRAYNEGSAEAPQGAYLYAGEGKSEDVSTGTAFTYNGMAGVYGTFTAAGAADEDGNLTIGLVEKENNFNWIVMRDVQLFVKDKEAANLDFAADAPEIAGVRTYAKDVKSDTAEKSQLQPVNGWTIVENGDARAAGTYAYGSEAFLGGEGFVAPAAGPEGNAGQALGLVGVWTGLAQYTQEVALEAGTHLIEVPVYNAGGAQAIDKNLIGANGTYATTTLYPVGEWTTEYIKIALDEKDDVVLSLGYKAANAGSADMPHLFIDKVNIISDAAKIAAIEDSVAAAKFAEEKDAALAKIDGYVAGEQLFAYPEEAIATAKAAVEAAEDADAIDAAIATLNAAQNKPVAGTAYVIANATAEGSLSVAEEKVTVAEGAEVYFTAVEGGYVISNEAGEYVFKTTGDSWTLSTTKDIAEAYVVTVNVVEGGYTIQGAKGLLGLDNIAAGSTVYANKAQSNNGLWTIATAEEVAISSIAADKAVKADGKYLENGAVVIYKNGKKFNVAGAALK